MGRAIPLPPLQGYEPCYRVNFTFTFIAASAEGNGRLIKIQ
jgi:hypothetical protein